MDPEDAVPIHRIVEMQGFDAEAPGRRNVYMVLDWTRGKKLRRYELSLVFDGDEIGLEDVLAHYEGSALCVGRGSISVGTDEVVPMTFARRFETGGQGTSKFLTTSRNSVSMEPRPEAQLPRTFGPFSAVQQQYAAHLVDLGLYTLYGFRIRWAADAESIEERYFVLQAETYDDAVALFHHHFTREYGDVDLGNAVVDMDDMRLRTVVSGFSLFSIFRSSQLDEFAFVESFRLGPIVYTDEF